MANNFDGFIIGGDLNAKSLNWGDTSDNANGKVINDWLQFNNLEITRVCNISPSYPNGSSFLDHFLLSPKTVNTIQPNFTIRSLPTFSDHFPLVLKLEIDSASLLIRRPLITTSYKNTDWNSFSNELEIVSVAISPSGNRKLSNIELDDLISTLNETIMSVHDAHSEKIEFNRIKRPYPENIKKFFKIKYAWQKELKNIPQKWQQM